MKLIQFILLLLTIGFISQSCLEDRCNGTRNFVQFNPVYMTGDELSYDINTVSNRTLKNPGKIYFYQNYIFINERGQGIHIYNNENPKQPEFVTFYQIPGNFDVAIKDDVLYADNPLYLMSIDITDIKNPTLINRSNIHNQSWYYENLDQRHVIYYTKSNLVRSFDCNNTNFNSNGFFEGNVFWGSKLYSSSSDVLSSAETSNGGTATNGTGIGGSFARFTIYKDYLYTVDNSILNVWDIENGTSIERINSKQIGWGIETIFPFEDKLFIGSNSGLFIFDNSDPVNPRQASMFTHAQACDPVVVSGNRAYVTLRDGNDCNGFENQLDVIDVTNIENPKLIKSYDMDNPHGLAIRDDILYICEGTFGLKIFDASNDNTIDKNRMKHLNDINAYDVISLSPEILFLIGSDGFFQYNVTSPKKPELISTIPVNHE